MKLNENQINTILENTNLKKNDSNREFISECVEDLNEGLRKFIKLRRKNKADINAEARAKGRSLSSEEQASIRTKNDAEYDHNFYNKKAKVSQAALNADKESGKATNKQFKKNENLAQKAADAKKRYEGITKPKAPAATKPAPIKKSEPSKPATAAEPARDSRGLSDADRADRAAATRTSQYKKEFANAKTDDEKQKLKNKLANSKKYEASYDDKGNFTGVKHKTNSDGASSYARNARTKATVAITEAVLMLRKSNPSVVDILSEALNIIKENREAVLCESASPIRMEYVLQSEIFNKSIEALDEAIEKIFVNDEEFTTEQLLESAILLEDFLGIGAGLRRIKNRSKSLADAEAEKEKVINTTANKQGHSISDSQRDRINKETKVYRKSKAYEYNRDDLNKKAKKLRDKIDRINKEFPNSAPNKLYKKAEKIERKAGKAAANYNKANTEYENIKAK